MNNNSVRITVIIVAAVVILALIGGYIATQTSPTSGNTVSVTGMSQIKATPDFVTVYFNIETNGTTAAEAKDKNAAIVDTVITNLVKQGFERKDITTENFNIYPLYDYQRAQALDGYRATHSLKVQISSNKTDLIGKAIDAGVDAGASVNYINFELSQETQNKYKTQALKAATEDAKIKAEAIASGLGKKLGKVVSISDSSFDYYPWPVYASSDMGGAAEAKQAATNIQPGEQTINARVSVAYKI